MDKRIVYTGDNGVAAVVIPTPEYLANGGTIEALMEKSVPEGVTDASIEDVDSIPSDRSFRNAWTTSDNSSVTVDLAKSKEVAKTKIREARDPALVKQDVAYQRADESGDADEKAAVIARKVVLRNAPADSRISDSANVDALKVAMNTIVDECSS
jgi:hypothetical protein